MKTLFLLAVAGVAGLTGLTVFLGSAGPAEAVAQS